jgi:hypothetical protein
MSDPLSPKVVIARFLWRRYDEMVDAWSGEPNMTDADEKKGGVKAL